MFARFFRKLFCCKNIILKHPIRYQISVTKRKIIPKNSLNITSWHRTVLPWGSWTCRTVSDWVRVQTTSPCGHSLSPWQPCPCVGSCLMTGRFWLKPWSGCGTSRPSGCVEFPAWMMKPLPRYSFKLLIHQFRFFYINIFFENKQIRFFILYFLVLLDCIHLDLKWWI